MNFNEFDKKSFLRNTAKAISVYLKGGESYEGATQSHGGDSQASLSLTPTQSTGTTSSEIPLVSNPPSDVQRRIDSLNEEEKALFNKFAIKYLEDKNDVVNRMTRAVVNHYPQVFPDLYNIYSTLYTNNSTVPNIENASQIPVSEQGSPISAPQAVANPAQREESIGAPANTLSSTASIVKAVVANKASQTTKPQGILGTIDGRFPGPPNTRNPLFTPWVFTPWAR